MLGKKVEISGKDCIITCLARIFEITIFVVVCFFLSDLWSCTATPNALFRVYEHYSFFNGIHPRLDGVFF